MHYQTRAPLSSSTLHHQDHHHRHEDADCYTTLTAASGQHSGDMLSSSNSSTPISTGHHQQQERDILLSPDASMSSSSYPSSSDSSFSSLSSSFISHASSDVHSISSRRQREQRRLLNRLAVYLPKPLRPIASSPARFISTLALSALSILFLFSSFSSSSSSTHPPPSLSALSSSSLFLPLGRTFRSPIKIEDHHQVVGEDSSLPRMVDVVEQQQEYQHHRQNHDTLHQAEKRDQQLVLEDLPLNDKASSSHIKPEKGKNQKSCIPDGYIRGVDAFKEREPTLLFRDNLRKDLKYMTFGMMNGFTSQFSALANGIYLAKLSDRIPILPPFAWAAHEDRKEAGYLSFSKVFDVTYLETMLRHPIQEWSNLKITAEDTSGLNESKNPQFENDKLRASALSKVKREKLSCWSLWASQMPDVGKPAGSAVQNHLGLDINYWEVPLSFSHPPKDRHIRYWDLVMLDQDINSVKSDHLLNVAHTKRSDVTAKLPSPPDDQLMCFDTLYYTAATGPEEWWQPHAPVWKAVGRYTRFNEAVSNLADEYLRSILDVEKNAKVPEFISVHMRRGTAQRICKDNKECLPQLEGYKRAVNRVREAILEARGVYVRWVIVTTDDRDSAFLGSIEALGWSVVDHTEMRTREKHGLWWEVVLDSAIQSKGSGFVGTERSSMSLVAGRRVEEWNKGPWELVKWGRKGAAL